MQRLFKNISPPLMANLLIIFTMIAWGTSFISTKIAIAEIPPFTLALLRLSLTSAILWPVFRHLEPATRLDSTGRRRFAITGFLGITLYFCLENMGLRFTTASNASLITSFAPLLSIALSVMFFPGPSKSGRNSRSSARHHWLLSDNYRQWKSRFFV